MEWFNKRPFSQIFIRVFSMNWAYFKGPTSEFVQHDQLIDAYKISSLLEKAK